MRREGQRTRR